jgi:hypothetical protein
VTPLASLLDRFARLIVRASCALLHRRRPDWSDAMLGEFDACTTTAERLGWAVGCIRTLGVDIAGGVTMIYFTGLLLSLALVANMEWRTDEATVTMAVLLVASLALGWFRPRLFLLSGVVLGLAVAAINQFTLLTGIRPNYESAAEASTHHLGYVLSLAVLVIPAVIAAFVGRLFGLAREHVAAG